MVSTAGRFRRRSPGVEFLVPAAILLVGWNGAAQPTRNERPLREFVCRQYGDSGAVPFIEARLLSDTSSLVVILQDKSMKECWYNAAMTLGAGGSAAAVQYLIQFITKGQSQLDQPEFDAKSGAILALGWAANVMNRTDAGRGRQAAIDFLIAATLNDGRNPWNSIRWSSASYKSQVEVRAYLTSRTIQALGLSGSAEALRALQSSSYCVSPRGIAACLEASSLNIRTRKGLGDLYK